MTTIPSLDPILDAVRAVRARLHDFTRLLKVGNCPDLATSILAGDALALEVGRELVAAIDQLHDDLAQIDPPATGFDGLALEHLLGVGAVVDAVLVAIGEQDSDDPEVNERFKPARLESQRRRYERFIDDLLVSRSARRLTADEESLLDQCERDLDLIAAGIEPE